MLSTYLVTSIADSGPGSLREAVIAANASPGHDDINFDIDGGGLQNISLLSALPALTDEVTLDGTTQGGYTGAPLVWLDGSGVIGPANGLTIVADNTLVRGLGITGFNLDGILIQGSDDSVRDNFIGVDPTGTIAASNSVNGIEINGLTGAAPASADIQGNVISANWGNGISFSENFVASEVINNRIGVDVSGSLALGNWANGIYIGQSDIALAGVTVRGNVISGNYGDGVVLDGAVNAVVAGNVIGTDSAGASNVDENGGLLSNFGNGISIQGSAANNIIGGPGASDRNLISGNFGSGVKVFADAGAGNVIQGNYVGTDLGGTNAIGNYGDGIYIRASGVSAVNNVLSGNYGDGVQIRADLNTVQGNLVGTGADGLTALPNLTDGFWIDGTGNIVGGQEAGEGNVVAFNFGNGITVNSGTGNAIRGNSIYSNAPGIGIDLGYDGVTLNDSMGHDGPNQYQNFPVLLNASRDGAAVTVQGTLAAAPSQVFTVEFFSNVMADFSGYGQGQTFVGSTVVTTDASGSASFDVTLNNVPDGQNVLTATATDAAGNTSEFSAFQAAGVVVGSNIPATATTLLSSANPSVFGQFVTFTATVTNLTPSGVPTGWITFMDGSTTLGTSNLDTSAQATWITSALVAGTHNITAVYFGGNQFKPSASDSLAQVVNPAALTVTVNAASKTYGASIPTFTDTITGFVNGDNSSVISGFANLTTTATAGSSVGTYAITAAQGSLSADNYTFTYVNSSLTVNPAVLTVTANAASKTYGAANPTFADTISGFVNGDTSGVVSGSANLTTAATAGSPVGTYAITVGQGTLSASNYIFTTFTSDTLTVNPAALTVTVNDASKTYGEANPGFSASYSGFVLGQDASVLSGALSFTTTATDSSNVGSYAVTPGGLGSTNYAITFADGTLTVNSAALTVTAKWSSKIYGAAMPTFMDTITGFVNGDTSDVVSGSASLTTTATIGSGVGTYTIAVAQGTLSASNYTFTTFTNGTLTVNPAALTVTANPAMKVNGATMPSLTASYTGFVNGDTPASLTAQAALSTAATPASHVGSYAITATGAVDADYTITYVTGSLTVTPAPLTVTANLATKVYGASMPSLTASYAGFVNGDTSSAVSGASSLTTMATASSPVGTYAITVAKGTLAANDYIFAYVNNTLTVTQASTATTLSSSANPSTFGQSVTFTANVSVVAPGNGPLTGSVVFMDGSNVLGTVALNNGTASLTTSALAVGNHSLTAVYSGDTNLTGSASVPLTEGVNPVPSTLSGYAYLDTNNDGIKQSSESGIASIQVTLSGNNDLGSIAPITVQTNASGYYVFQSLRPGTYKITEAAPSGYVDGKDTIGTQGGTSGNDVFTNVVLGGGVNGANYNFGELKNVISGQTLRDMSGNGLTDDDVALPGTTVNLYLERTGNNTLDSGDGAAVATTVSDASGSYTFVNVAPGQYYAREVVPSGYIRTIPYLSDYYSVDLSSTMGNTNFTFDNYKQCTGTITNVSFKINNTKTVTDLRSQTKQGDTVTVTFTVAGTTPAYVTFVTYNAPSATFDANIASQQTIDMQVGGMFTPGVHSLTVTTPRNYYQIDFVKCVAIDQLGPAGSNIFYSAQNRLISADNAGTHSDIDDMSASTAFWANLGQTLIRSFNVTDANQTPTGLGNWLAQNFSNIYGSSGPNNMAGKTNSQVAAFFLQLFKNPARTTDAQVLATALNVYASTTALGGEAGTFYQFDVTDPGLGAANFSVLSYGSAFGVSNNTTLTVWQILQATNSKSKNDVLYNGVSSMLSTAYSLYYLINTAGGIA